MTEQQPSAGASSDKATVDDYLAYNRSLQKWAWLASAVPIVVFVAVVSYGTLELKNLQQNVQNAKADLEATRQEITRRQVEIKQLQDRSAELTRQINNAIASPTETGQSSHYSVSGHPVMISINIAESRNRSEAEQVANVFRLHGYTVTEIDVKRLSESPHETTVRFFQYDKSTVAIGRDLVALMKSTGFNVRTEFDDEFVGAQSGPAPGTFEVWIGTNPSYAPANRAPS
jgi:hypothetical protein